MALPCLPFSGRARLGAGQFIVPASVDANGMPTTHSTPQEHAATADLNNQVANTNASTDQTASAKPPPLTANIRRSSSNIKISCSRISRRSRTISRSRRPMPNQTAHYENLRARYRRRTRRLSSRPLAGRLSRWTLDEMRPDLIGQRVEIINGDHVGTVTQCRARRQRPCRGAVGAAG